jgi:2EXR family
MNPSQPNTNTPFFLGLPRELREEIYDASLQEVRIIEMASMNEDQVHIKPVQSRAALSVNSESRQRALQTLTLIQLPRRPFYIYPQQDVFHVDDLKALFRWEGDFADPTTDWPRFCRLVETMAIDPLYAHPGNPDIARPPWGTLISEFSGHLYGVIGRFPSLKKVILCSRDPATDELKKRVKEFMEIKKKVEEEEVEDSKDDEKEQKKKGKGQGLNRQLPEIIVLSYQSRDGETAMNAMRRVVLAHLA